MNKFKDIKELEEWLSKHDYKIENFELVEISKDPDKNEKSCKCDESTDIGENYNDYQVWKMKSSEEEQNIQINIKSLTEQPTIKVLPLSESENNKNIWYVDDFEFIKDACGTSRIIYNDSMVLMNVCESEDEAVVTLLTEINSELKKIPFVLNKACNNDNNYDMILFL